MNEPLSLKDIARLSGLEYNTLFVYRRRGTLPEADHQVGNKPLWNKSTIDQWLETRRTKNKTENKPN
jgi:predicted DNA-binding transcriptional regulator AlpA